ncbi:putative bifunctional diguanylate cyclase/phosphodiesterase [Qipengyuania sp. MTN3-11]|uniref:putative bifunctional diguanylate cyclase/phosphodiesterase n=1 Tax=Qipengyuania sp. MTN3-11 TaxID=3056557 RepID=UPI0036F25B60
MAYHEEFNPGPPVSETLVGGLSLFPGLFETGAIPHILALLAQYCEGETAALVRSGPEENAVLLRHGPFPSSGIAVEEFVPLAMLRDAWSDGQFFSHGEIVGVVCHEIAADEFVAMLCRRRSDALLDARAKTALALLGKVAGRLMHLRREVSQAGTQLQQQVALTARLEDALKHDFLTGLCNRAGLRAELDGYIERGEPCALVLLDLDDFKYLNDSYGHDVGDAILRHVAQALHQGTRAPHVIARLGGDEFAMLIPGIVDHGALRKRIGSLCVAAAKPFAWDGREITCNISAGGCLFPADGRTLKELYRHADVTLRLAKQMGGGGVRVFDADARAEIDSESDTKAIIEDAIRHDRIVPHYQPQIDPRTGNLIGVEVLSRIEDGNGNLLMPCAYRSAFQRSDLSRVLRSATMNRVRRDMEWLASNGIVLDRVAINISTSEIVDPDLPQIFEQLGLPPEKVEIEITEDVMIGRTGHRIRSIVEGLRDHGVRIALDDFGTGFASLAHLESYPVDTIKIDRTFVQSLGRTTKGSAIVRAIMQLGRDLDLEVVAEGVETDAQLQFLKKNGCMNVQGMLLAPPLSIHELAIFAGRGIEVAA